MAGVGKTGVDFGLQTRSACLPLAGTPPQGVVCLDIYREPLRGLNEAPADLLCPGYRRFGTFSERHSIPLCCDFGPCRLPGLLWASSLQGVGSGGGNKPSAETQCPPPPPQLQEKARGSWMSGCCFPG